MLVRITTYVKTGYLLHLITVIQVLLLYLLLHNLHAASWMMERDTFARFVLLFPVLWAPIFPQLDARARFQNYKMMKDYFYPYGFDARLVKYFSKSRCQRDAVLVAAKATGFYGPCKAYFNGCGYRWYHLLPDIIFERPLVLFSWAFYENTFFVKTYHSKICCNTANVKPSKLTEMHINTA